MDYHSFADSIDHTALDPDTTLTAVEEAVGTAERLGTNVCIPPCFVADAAEIAPGVTLSTVCGFPHGQEATATKEVAAERAWKDGADEIEVLLNIGWLRAGDDDAVFDQLERIVATVPIPVTVIVEAPLLSVGELRTACELANEGGAAFLSTATDFADGNATAEDVAIMAEYLPVKASGGIESFEEALALLEAGAERIGVTDGESILESYDIEAIEASSLDLNRE